MHSFLAGSDSIDVTLVGAAPIEMPMIVHAVHRAVEHLARPLVSLRICRNKERQQPRSVSLRLGQR